MQAHGDCATQSWRRSPARAARRACRPARRRVPAVASAGSPLALMSQRPSGCARTLPAPFSTTCARNSRASSRAALDAVVLHARDVVPSRRAASPGCGVAMRRRVARAATPRAGRVARDQVQRIGVEHDGNRLRERAHQQRARRVAGAESRPARPARSAGLEHLVARAAASAPACRYRAPGDRPRGSRPTPCRRRRAAPRARPGAARRPCRRAADDAERAERSLVHVALAARRALRAAPRPAPAIRAGRPARIRRRSSRQANARTRAAADRGRRRSAVPASAR